MQQYVIIARDGQDEDALTRRMAARGKHLEGVGLLKQTNNFVSGGAMLNEDGQMIGSVMIAQFETEEEFQNWYQHEPYITQNIWKDIEVKKFRVAVL